MENSKPPRSGTNYIPAFLIGILGTALLALLCLIVFGGLAYLRGYSVPPILTTPTRTPTLPLPSTLTVAASSTAAPTLTPSATSTPTPTFTASPTFILNTPTSLPTRTKTPIPAPTKTKTPTPTKTPSFTTIHDTHYGITYNAWIGLADNKAYGKGMRCSSRKNEVLAFEIPKNTAKVNLFFYRGPNQGKARIIIDDAEVETLDLYKNAPQYLYEWKYPSPNPKQAHQVKIVVLREKRNASSGFQVCFDGFRLNNKPMDDTYYGVRYDAWSGASNQHALGDSYRVATAANSTLTFNIQGSSFDWFTARGPNYGLADIYVDDQFAMTVDLFFPGQQWEQVIHLQNLGNGRHTIKIVVLGQRHPSSSGDGIVFDGFRIP